MRHVLRRLPPSLQRSEEDFRRASSAAIGDRKKNARPLALVFSNQSSREASSLKTDY